ncbi:MAG TPA: aminotransferase class V-fold PLP-dependent enzyme, partial [Nitrososphaera sp.]|nr:aminotransferase class V-fold PLP-dependent enzyme [Nitrososphaera sp.]
TLDAHKMQGPKGVGALVVRRHVLWEPLMIGGGQERGKRPTTENVLHIAAFAEALALASDGREERVKNSRLTQEYFFDLIEKELPNAVINGSREKRLPNNINISLSDLADPELAVLFLDKNGIACSTKSSCLKGEENSYVVASISKSDETWRARNTIRFSLAPNAVKRDVLHIVETLKRIPRNA